MYEVKFHSQVKKQTKKLHPQDQKRFFRAVNRLKKNPYSKTLDIKRLENTRLGWRLRLGDIRILYSIEKKGKTIYIWEVGYRGSIY